MGIAAVSASDELVHRIVQAARAVHSTLGPGFLEGVYGRALVVELKSGGLNIEQEKLIKIWYGSQLVGRHRLDLVIEGSVIVELKANRGIVAVHAAQMRSYLQATGLATGILLNFGIPDLEWELIIRPAATHPESDDNP